ncbi:MAG: hypothetical protein M0D55_05590 [Elusimicrobiota bacterium]|nr:MAG: hypothetical protein M0D55_05590 [Elusimicrobiota bacterium]
MLKTALLKETEGTFAGNDLKEFYATAPLTVTFTTTSLAALGWYMNGGDTLYFNERYVEGYIKSRGLSVEDVMKNPEHLGDLARTLVGTFVHEAQHHRQNFWARQNSVPNGYNQLNEIEAFQVQGLFLLEKLKNDKKFAEFAEREGAHSDVLRAGLGRAKIMEEHGPDMFEYTVPNGHYPETYSNAGGAWCRILWHNNTAKKMEDELARRATLDARERAALESGPQLAEYYESPADFAAALRAVSTGSLTRELARSRKEAAETPKYYNQIRERRERFARETKERHAVVMGGGNGREKRSRRRPEETNDDRDLDGTSARRRPQRRGRAEDRRRRRGQANRRRRVVRASRARGLDLGAQARRRDADGTLGRRASGARDRALHPPRPRAVRHRRGVHGAPQQAFVRPAEGLEERRGGERSDGRAQVPAHGARHLRLRRARQHLAQAGRDARGAHRGSGGEGLLPALLQRAAVDRRGAAQGVPGRRGGLQAEALSSFSHSDETR